MKVLIKIWLIVTIILLSSSVINKPGISAIFNFSQDVEGEAVNLFSCTPATSGKPPFEMIHDLPPKN